MISYGPRRAPPASVMLNVERHADCMSIGWLLLTCAATASCSAQSFPREPVVPRDVLHEQAAGAAVDELHSETVETGELGVRRGDQRHFASAVHVGDQLSPGDGDRHDARGGSPERLLLLVGADVLRQDR